MYRKPWQLALKSSGQEKCSHPEKQASMISSIGLMCWKTANEQEKSLEKCVPPSSGIIGQLDRTQGSGFQEQS